jgi:NADPH:quinone reductase-like Zn-dependent oxidoreductase
MDALVVLHDGFSGTAEGPAIDSLDPYVELRKLPVPKPGKGQVLVQVRLANINPSDLHFIKGEYGLPRTAGAPAGFEGCGTVVAAGEGADKLVGKRVGFIAARASGAWAEYALAEANACVPVVDAVRDEDAAALFVNPLTAIAMFDEVKEAGSKAFIMSAAASQLCKLIAGLAREEGYEAISLVRHDEQIAHLKELGAAHVLNITDNDFMAELAGLIKAGEPRIFLDAVADQLSSDIFFAMPRLGQWVIYGKLSPQPPKLTQPGQFIFLEKQVRGFWLTKWMREKPPEVVAAAGARVQETFASRKWQTDIAAIVPLGEAHARLPQVLAGANTGKVMLKP